MLKFLKSLFSRRKQHQPPKYELMLSYNVEELASKLDVLGQDLYRSRMEDSVGIIKKIVEAARNIQILEVNRVNPESMRLHHHRGRLEALNDLLAYIARNLDHDVYNERKEKEKSAGIKSPRLMVKSGHRSGSVI